MRQKDKKRLKTVSCALFSVSKIIQNQNVIYSTQSMKKKLFHRATLLIHI